MDALLLLLLPSWPALLIWFVVIGADSASADGTSEESGVSARDRSAVNTKKYMASMHSTAATEACARDALCIAGGVLVGHIGEGCALGSFLRNQDTKSEKRFSRVKKVYRGIFPRTFFDLCMRPCLRTLLSRFFTPLPKSH